MTGVDHSPVMTNMARARLRPAIRDGRANIILGGVEQLKSFGQSLDAIYSANVIQFLGDKTAFYELAHTALGEGGRMATTYQPRGKNPSAAQGETIARQCAAAMATAGFSNIRTGRLDLGKAPAICVIGVK